MHHDQKVGLALGVLLIGAVTAFFFRNEVEPTTRIPTLRNSEDVDREIAEKRLTPYFSDPDANSPPAVPASRTVADNDLRTGERTLSAADVAPASGTENTDPFDVKEAKQVPAPAPDPITVAGSTAAAQPAEAVADTNSAPAVEVAAAASAPEQPTGPWHEVQKGDTLSSIAGKYLGSHSRYQEVFDANRDLLRNPNDLQVGMKLKIPGSKPAAAQRVPAISTSHSTSAAETITSESLSPADQSALPDSTSKSTEESIPPALTAPKTRFTPSRRRNVPAGAGN